MVILLCTLAGGILGCILGAVTFKSISNEYTILFGADMGLPFGAAFGFVWGCLFGKVAINCGILKAGFVSLGCALAMTIIPAIMGRPGLLLFSGIVGWLLGPLVLLGLFNNRKSQNACSDAKASTTQERSS